MSADRTRPQAEGAGPPGPSKLEQEQGPAWPRWGGEGGEGWAATTWWQRLGVTCSLEGGSNRILRGGESSGSNFLT